jgi:ectonucleoside triphosphate diphosphohydrolase 5/6
MICPNVSSFPRSTTPLALRATAGLRLLPASKAEGLLQVVRGFFGASDFHVAPDAVSILDSVEEGYFGWISVNFLLGRGNIGDAIDVASTVATLDLGGASTQVTFAPRLISY